MNAPNAIAGSQATDETEVQPGSQPGDGSEVEVSAEPETPEVAPVEGEGAPETPEVPEAGGDGTGTEGAAETPVVPVEPVLPAEPQIKKSDVQKRIDALTRRRYQLETQNTHLQNELEELKRQTQQIVQPGQTPGQPASGQPAPQVIPNVQIDPAQLGLPPKPTKEQFETNDAFLENMAIWQAVYEVRRQTVVQRQFDIQARQTAAQNAVIENWNTALEKAREKYDDFDDVVGAETKIPQAAFTAIVDSPVGTEIAYYLGKHPEAVRGLNQFTSPVAIMREIGKLEAKLATAPVPSGTAQKQNPGASPSTPKPAQTKPGTQSQPAPGAPQKPKPKTSQPITPVGTSRPVSTSTTSTKDPGQMTYREYKTWREKNGAKR